MGGVPRARTEAGQSGGVSGALMSMVLVGFLLDVSQVLKDARRVDEMMSQTYKPVQFVAAPGSDTRGCFALPSRTISQCHAVFTQTQTPKWTRNAPRRLDTGGPLTLLSSEPIGASVPLTPPRVRRRNRKGSGSPANDGPASAGSFRVPRPAFGDSRSLIDLGFERLVGWLRWTQATTAGLGGFCSGSGSTPSETNGATSPLPHTAGSGSSIESSANFRRTFSAALLPEFLPSQPILLSDLPDTRQDGPFHI